MQHGCPSSSCVDDVDEGSWPRSLLITFLPVCSQWDTMENIWEKTQKEWLKNMILACKPDHLSGNLWGRVTDMVGYFNAEEGRSHHEQMVRGVECAMGPLIDAHVTVGDRAQEPPVKRVVCSPDLPVFSLTRAFEEAAVESTTTATATSPEKTYKCSFCNKTFNQKNTYQNHLRSHGKEGEDPYVCNICSKSFAVPARLTRHYRTHTGEKPYQCEYCNKSFSVKENLSVHRRIHTKERPYKCDICERAFEHSGKLHRHMRIHTGERPHKCAVCAKTFIQSGQLVIHTRTHTGEKPYVCQACGKGFTCSKQLKVHTRTHTGEKPYSCDICGKSFGYNHVLKLHQVAHYGEKVYKCTICNDTFTSKKIMEIHIKSHSEPTASATTINAIAQSVRSNGQETTDSRESSCTSTTSDKENKADSDSEPLSRVPPISCIRNNEDEMNGAESQPRSNSPPTLMVYSSSQHSPSSEQQQHHLHHQERQEQHHQHHHQQQQQQQQQQEEQQQPHPNMRELCYYLYPQASSPQMYHSPPPHRHLSGGVNPALLAAAAAAAASEGRNLSPPPTIELQDRRRQHMRHEDEQTSRCSRNSSPESMAEPPLVIEPSVYLYPEPLGSMHRRSSPYHFQLPPPEYLEPPVLINLPSYSNNRRRPEQEEERMVATASVSVNPLTPPHSNPSSPDPIDLATVTREVLILPPRKRSKMILKSMETAEAISSSIRYSSVIHYAKAS